MDTRPRYNPLLIAVFLAVSLLAPLHVGAPAVALAATACPPRLAVSSDSWSNKTLPPGAAEVKSALGGVKTVNQGFGQGGIPGASGYTYNGVYYNPFHRGIDFNDIYQKLYSPWPATIKNYVGGGWGTGPGGPNMVVEINLSNGYRVYVLHLSDFGATGSVKAGTYIGTTGNTGHSTGPHSHIEVDAPDGSIIPPEWWACKTGAPAGSPGVTENTGSTSLDRTDDFSTGTSLATPPWIYAGSSTVGKISSAGTVLLSGGCCGYNAAVQETKSDGSVRGRILKSTSAGGLTFRFVDTNNLWWVGFSNGGVFGLHKEVAGSGTVMATFPLDTAAKYRVSFVGDKITVFNGSTQVASVTDSTHVGAKKHGFFTRNGSESEFDDFQYTENPDGTLTKVEAGADPATSDGNEDTAGWNVMGWMWDKLKGLLVPTEDDWKEIAAELDKLTDKEPIGTLKDVAAFAGTIKSAVSTPPAAGATPAITGGTCSSGKLSGLFCWLTFEKVWQGAVNMSGTVAGAVDTFQVAGMNGTTFIKVGIDVIAAFSVWEYLQSRTVLAA